MECELCAKGIKTIRKVKVENSVLVVCENCTRFGEEVLYSGEQVFPASSLKSQQTFCNIKDNKILRGFVVKLQAPSNELEDFGIVENFAYLIKREREKRNMKQEEFAKFLNERESVIRNIEVGKHEPGLELAKKLERKLGIKLLESI